MRVCCIDTTKTKKTTKAGDRDPAYDVIGCAIEVDRLLEPGLLESAYEQCPRFYPPFLSPVFISETCPTFFDPNEPLGTLPNVSRIK